MTAWQYTKDRADPCVLCVQWEETGEPFADDFVARPYRPDGSTVERVFNGTHNDCLRDAVAYTTEASGL